jgi:hypothetical protein
MDKPSAEKTFEPTFYITPPYKTIFGTLFDAQQFISSVYYNITDTAEEKGIKNDFPLVLDIDV